MEHLAGTAWKWTRPVRHKLNVLFVICNNANYTARRSPTLDPTQYLGYTRYDKIMEAFGGHGEYVDQPDEIRPALERAVASSKPAVVNVIVDEFAFSNTDIGLKRADLSRH